MANFENILIEFTDETYVVPDKNNITINYVDDSVLFNFTFDESSKLATGSLNFYWEPEGYTVNTFNLVNSRDNNFYFVAAKKGSTISKGKMYILSADNYHAIDLSNRNVLNEIPFPFTGQEPNFVYRGGN
jgi:hypothetical protein